MRAEKHLMNGLCTRNAPGLRIVVALVSCTKTLTQISAYSVLLLHTPILARFHEGGSLPRYGEFNDPAHFHIDCMPPEIFECHVAEICWLVMGQDDSSQGLLAYTHQKLPKISFFISAGLCN